VQEHAGRLYFRNAPVDVYGFDFAAHGRASARPPVLVDPNTLLRSLFWQSPTTVTVLPFDPDPRLLGAFLALVAPRPQYQWA